MTEKQSTPSEPVRPVGSLKIADGTGIVRIEGRLDIHIDAVWAALTEPERLAHWLGTFEGNFRVGGDFHARYFASGWEGTGHIEVCQPPQHLLVSTMETGTTDLCFVDVTLSAEGEQTVLVLEERNMPPEHLAAYGAGIQIHVEDLTSYLRGGERCDAQTRWNELFSSYASKSVEPV